MTPPEPSEIDEPIPERRIDDVETLKAISDPLRLRILEAMVQRPTETWTVKRLAATLDVPPTRLYHHVDVLAERDLIRVGGQRVVQGIIETSYRIAQLRVSLSPTLLAAGTDDEPARHALLATLFDVARDDLERGLASGRFRLGNDGPPLERPLISKGVVRLAPARALAFRAQIEALLAEEDATDDAAQPFGFVVAFYPAEPDKTTHDDEPPSDPGPGDG